MRFLTLAACIAACSFSPDLGEGALACASDNSCPEGYGCNAADHRCYRNGGPSIDAPVDAPADAPVDAPTIDAAPDAFECSPGAFLRCDGDSLVRCNADGDGEDASTCANGCDATHQSCNICMVGSMICDSQGHVLSCTDGTGYVPADCPASSNPCQLNLCQGAGQCTLQNKPDSTPCPTGICVGGSCACGGQGQPCCGSGVACQGGLSCMNGTCGACGATGQPCCPNQTCAAGNLCSGSSCVACGAPTQPCCSGNACNLGAVCGGNDTCAACGAQNQPCCTTGAACGSNLSCVGQTCHCGGIGEPCCGGSACNAPATCGGGGMPGICDCNTSSDPQNCGSCGHVCPGPRFGSGSAICTGGTCGLSCAAGSVPCNGACVTTTTDPQNCGGCGADLSAGQTANTHNCVAGKTCSSSACVAVCEPQTTNCGGSCVNEQTDGSHCGGCNACGLFGGNCNNGNCGGGCATGTTQCSRSCTNLQIDPTNCGSCGNNCGQAGLCVAGSCKSFIYAAAAAECPPSQPTFCSNAHTGNKGVCVTGTTCP